MVTLLFLPEGVSVRIAAAHSQESAFEKYKFGLRQILSLSRKMKWRKRDELRRAPPEICNESPCLIWLLAIDKEGVLNLPFMRPQGVLSVQTKAESPGRWERRSWACRQTSTTPLAVYGALSPPEEPSGGQWQRRPPQAAGRSNPLVGQEGGSLERDHR